jgi:hypothetical protein
VTGKHFLVEQHGGDATPVAAAAVVTSVM